MLKKKKLTELENKVPDISNLATKAVLTAVEKKPSVSNLVKKAGYNTDISELEKKLLIIIMINMLLPQNLILQLLMFLMQD